MDSIISEQKAGNFLGTAHIYQASLNAFGAFTGSKNILFRQMTPALLKRFEHYLRLRGNSWNTVSTYMRALRAVYNRAVDRQLAPYSPRLFKPVYTGTQADVKRSLKAEEMGLLLQMNHTAQHPEAICRAHKMFFYLCSYYADFPLSTWPICKERLKRKYPHLPPAQNRLANFSNRSFRSYGDYSGIYGYRP